MTKRLKQIKLNLYKLFWKYPYLKNKNYNYLYFKYCLEFHFNDWMVYENLRDHTPFRPEFWENMPAMESISRCKRKLAKTDDMFRPDKKEVIESRLKQTNEILESVKD
jgi:hypothetical protein